MKVVKFGGTSLADANQIKKVCDIVLSDSDRRIVVVSAPGKRFSADTKMTDMLIDCANYHLEGKDASQKLQKIIDRFAEIANDLGVPAVMDEIESDLRKRMQVETDNLDRFMDNMKAAGEDNNAKVVAAYLSSIGENAKYINPKHARLILHGEFGEAQVADISYKYLSKLKETDCICVFPGFFGYNEKGEVMTFPRGGSDITGAILAAAVDATCYENFTDVDYVYSVNPNLINQPQPIKSITYREMRELSYAGFNVYQEDALLPVYNVGIPVNIKNVNNPSCPGTLIQPGRESGDNPIIGIASDNDFCCIHMSKYLMNKEVGFGRRVLEVLESEGISFEHLPTGIDTMSVIIRENQLKGSKTEKVIKRITNELGVTDISIRHGLCIVMIVGEGMLHHVGIMAKAATAMAEAGVNIEMISQGSSEVSMVFVIKNSDSDRAVRALYQAFFE